jgi:beta-catenin-like protein 1
MTSVDELFKKPGLPSGGLKRKLEVPDAQQVYKATKLSSTTSPNGRHADVEDVPEDDDDLEAGPELPPEGDEEGGDRFFGGGVTRDAAQALDYIEEQDGDGVVDEKIDSSWLRRLAVSFEKKVKRNAELRARYEGDPQKFMASEADLDQEIKSWSALSEHSDLYNEFAKSESVGLLVGLLAHENTDIAIGTIEIISELLDEDVEAESDQWDVLVAALLDNDLLELLMSNLRRLDEDNESDRSGVYHSLAVIEALASQQSVAEKVGSEKLLDWLCNRIKAPEKLTSQNKQYAAEVLQVLLQSSPLLRRRLAVDVDGVDLFLQLLAAYRKRDPGKESTEEEYAENVFDALTCVVDEPDGKRKFVEAEGVELALIMLKEGSFSKLRALRLLDHACGGMGAAATEVCEKLVDAAGLKIIFSMFMKKAANTAVEHLLDMFSSLLRLLPGESAARIRVLAKFTERECEKVLKLLKLRLDYTRRLAAVDKEIRAEQSSISADEAEERADEFYSRRLEGGLFVMQTIDVVLAWLVAEDILIRAMISERDGGLAFIRASLQEQLSALDAPAADDEDEVREMLKTLIDSVQ